MKAGSRAERKSKGGKPLPRLTCSTLTDSRILRMALRDGHRLLKLEFDRWVLRAADGDQMDVCPDAVSQLIWRNEGKLVMPEIRGEIVLSNVHRETPPFTAVVSTMLCVPGMGVL